MTKQEKIEKKCKHLMSISETVKKPNSQKEDCPQCKDLPEGEVVKGHDHRPNKPNSQKDNQATSESDMQEWNEVIELNKLVDLYNEHELEEGNFLFFVQDYVKKALQAQKDRLIEKLEAKKAKEVSDELVNEVGKQMIRDGLRHVIGGVYNNALKDAIDVVRSP